jgi:hypothetical protein
MHQKYIILAIIQRRDKVESTEILKLGVTKNAIRGTSKKACCGLDVYKKTIFATIIANGKAGEVTEYGTLICRIKTMSDYLKGHGVTDAAMESTCMY